ncbi:hypothetical protein NVP1031O_132 [Vibrio phage 1.031.O._10N.261.46.F8]|nr:hypothetical protein NVP1031O_132 [Vibrio phage 1.031.O._10N.261.46.F8]
MAANKSLFNIVDKSVATVSALDLDSIELEKSSNRARLDDDIGGDRLEDVTTMLNTNPEFKKWYIELQRRASDATDVNMKRELELKLIYPFAAYRNTLQGKAKAMWEGDMNTISDHRLNTAGENAEDGHAPTYDELGTGNATANYVDPIAGKQQARRRELNKRTTEGEKQDTSYAFTGQSIGPFDPGAKTRSGTVKHTVSSNPAEGVMTANVLRKLIRDLKSDEKAMAVFLAMLVRWNIALPTYIPRNEVPAMWHEMMKDVKKQGGRVKATKNMRKFLEPYGVKDFRPTRSPEMQTIQKAMLKVTDSKTAKELAATLNKPLNQGSGADRGKYFGIPTTPDQRGGTVTRVPLWESFNEAVRLDMLASNAINESHVPHLEVSFNEAVDNFMSALMNPTTPKSQLN